MNTETTASGLLMPQERPRAAARVMPGTEPMSPTALVSMAVQQGASLEYVRQLMDMRRELDADEARRAYNRAFAAFKSQAVRIIKSTTVTDGPLKGKSYAQLHDVVNAVTPALSDHGLSAAWKLTKDEKDWIEVTCTIRHEQGHSESVSMGGPPDTGGAKNAIQARASTVSYLERYTLKAIAGLAEQSDDNDGNGGGGEPKYITEDEAATIQALIDDAGADKAKFLEFLKVDSIAHIAFNDYAKAVGVLNEKKRKGAGK